MNIHRKKRAEENSIGKKMIFLSCSFYTPWLFPPKHHPSNQKSKEFAKEKFIQNEKKPLA